MMRCWLPLIAIGWLISVATTKAADPAAPRPNIVVILMDDLRWDLLGCAGHPVVHTPHIDRIAAEGALFRNAFVTTPLCLPSRASFLSGQYAHTHGITGAGTHETHEFGSDTLATRLHDAGYTTGYIGKWHIGRGSAPRPGFDRWVSFDGQGDYVAPKLDIDGKVVTTAGYLTDELSDLAVGFIKHHAKQPFCLYLAHKAVHAPFIPAERHRNLFADVPVVRAASAQDDLRGKPVLRRPGITLKPNDPDVTSSDELIRNQWRCLLAVDEGVGRIFRALEETGALDNTLVIFTSDHGYFWGEHGLGGKHGPYEEAIRVPLLVRYPPLVKPGTRIDELVLSIDLAPTLMALAGASAQRMQGRSLLPLSAGDIDNWRTAILTEYFYHRGQTPRFPTWQSVRTMRWKYIRYPDATGMDELYDLASDPLEMKNRIGEPAAQAVEVELQQQLESLLTESRAPAATSLRDAR